jgi:hypothetical protein
MKKLESKGCRLHAASYTSREGIVRSPEEVYSGMVLPDFFYKMRKGCTNTALWVFILQHETSIET